MQTPKNSHIHRFLKARDYQADKAREMLCHSLAWRKRHGIDQILDSYKPPQVIMDYYAGGWHYFDRGELADGTCGFLPDFVFHF